VGSGSGILAIAAALVGPAQVLGVEVDEWAVAAARDNVRRNGVEGRVTIRHAAVSPGSLPGLGRWDGVVANMETGRLRPLLGGLTRAALPGGWIILSGILESEFDEVRDEMVRLGNRCDRIDADGEWRSGLFSRAEPPA
jgi:ribosomal protein L11 methyltransferase